MKGSETKLVSYLQGSDKRFIIPVYQRNYDWKIENCKQLYDDLIKVSKRNLRSHFFGSIVSAHNDGEFNEYLVIDGQQRLTTISLLLLAMYNLMKNGVLIPNKGILADKIYKTYLIDEWQDDDTRIKLKPVKNDRNAFSKLFSDERSYIPDSNLTINYNYFYNRIQKEEITLDELYEAITKLEIINITLNGEDNPQLIFESLNSTGVALSEGDKIRNFILMGLPVSQQTQYYENYWNPIESCTNYDVSTFIRDYLSVKQQMIPAMSKVYFTFKAYVEEIGIETEKLLKDILEYARRYETLIKGNTEDEELNNCIYRLNRLETTVTRPFFLEVMRLQAENILSLNDVKKIFFFTENYLFRRAICDLPTNALSKIFLMLNREIIRYDGTTNNYLEKFKYALNAKSERVKFPSDENFVEALSSRPVYQMNSKNKIYILERFENFGTVETQEVYKKVDDGTYSIEHIMPQHLTPVWMDELGPNYLEIHEIWLHRLANLTLTGYNSKYSNNPFADKKEMANGFKHSHIYMNKWIGEQDCWRLEELEKRNQLLMERALQIWPAPKTNYQPAAKQMDNYTLSDDVDLSGRSIVRFAYKNAEQPVFSWIDMFEQMLKMLHNNDKSVLSQLAYDTDNANDLSVYVSNNTAKLRNPMKIDSGIFVEKNTSTSTKISILRKFFKAYGANEDDLVFYLRDENATDTDISVQEELRIKYWNYALPLLQKAHDDGSGHGCYTGCVATKSNWMGGSFGIGGFSIGCVANFNEAKVTLALSSSDKERNKKAYDYLFSKKADIEKNLSKTLDWQRKDDGKASYIVVSLGEVSVANEADWKQMANFHVEWSKKFFDSFVHYLKTIQ